MTNPILAQLRELGLVDTPVPESFTVDGVVIYTNTQTPRVERTAEWCEAFYYGQPVRNSHMK